MKIKALAAGMGAAILFLTSIAMPLHTYAADQGSQVVLQTEISANSSMTKNNSAVVELADGSIVSVSGEAVQNGLLFLVERISAENGTDYNKITTAMKDKGSNQRIYDIRFIDSKGQPVQPKGQMTVSISLNGQYTKPCVYYVAADMSTVVMTSTVAGDTISFVTEHNSYYVLTENKSENNNTSDSGNSGGGNSSDSGNNDDGESKHTHSYTSTITKSPTCTDAGIKTYTCSKCKNTYTELLPALGHDYHSSITTQPTIYAEGVMTYTCSRCGHSYTNPIARLQAPVVPNTPAAPTQPAGTDKPANTPAVPTGPYVEGQPDHQGWENVLEQIEKVKTGDTIIVDMNGTTTVSADVLGALRGKDVTVVFDLGNGITWSVNGKTINADKLGDIDFGVSVGKKTIPVDIINNVTGERYSMEISIAYDGEFGFTAVFSVDLEPKNAGLYANLFYYAPETTDLEFVCASLIDDTGIAQMEFTHASDYVIVVDQESMEPKETVAEGDTEGSTDAEVPAETEAGTDTAESGTMQWLLWGSIAAAILMAGFVIVLVRRKNENGDKLE